MKTLLTLAFASAVVLSAGTAMSADSSPVPQTNDFHALSQIKYVGTQQPALLSDTQLAKVEGGVYVDDFCGNSPKWPFPGPRPSWWMDKYKDMVINPQYTTSSGGSLVMFNPQPEPPISPMQTLGAR